MKASDLFIKCLENEGVKYIFGVAGEENLDLLESIRKSEITYVPVRHEQAAGFMAATIGRLTGKPGVALSTLGPGATNLVTAVAYAKLGAMPMVVLTGQKPIKTNPQGNFQIVDIPNLMRPITQLTTSISFSNRIPEVVRESFRVAEQERPGPVHIELPKDIAKEEVENTKPFGIEQVRRPIAEHKAVSRAVEMIQNAKSPLILIGAGANRKITRKMLTELIEKTKIPFVNTQMGKGVVDERNERFIGTAALSAGDIVHKAIESADLIINVGHDIIEKSPFLMKPDSKFKVIHIHFFGAQVHEYYHPQLEVIGDIANALWQIKEHIQVQESWDFEKMMEIKQQIEKEIYSDTDGYEDNAPTIKPQKLVGAVRNAIADDSVLCLDNGMYKLWFARFFKAYEQNSILLDNALATMGAGLPSAIATALQSPSKQVICIAGDGGLMMSIQELETAVRLKINLTILLLNDSGLGMIKWEQAHKGFKNYGLEHGNPDFVKLAESFGINASRVRTTKELHEKLSVNLNKKGINLIEVPIDYSDNGKVFNV